MLEDYKDDPDEDRKKKILIVSEAVRKTLAERCPSVDFTELPEYVKSKSEMDEFLTGHKKDGARVVKKEERKNASKCYEENVTEITSEAIDYMRLKKAKELSSLYPEGDIKLFVAKHWTLEYEIARSGLFKELDMAVCMAKMDQRGSPIEFDVVKKNISDCYKEGTNESVAYKIFKPINDGDVSKAIIAQYLADILETNRAGYKQVLETDDYLAYLVDAIKYVTSKKA